MHSGCDGWMEVVHAEYSTHVATCCQQEENNEKMEMLCEWTQQDINNCFEYSFNHYYDSYYENLRLVTSDKYYAIS